MAVDPDQTWEAPTEPSGEDTHPMEVRATSLKRGASVGRYVVLEHLGAGGMGVVYAAYDPELDRRIALKLLAPRSRAPEHLERARKRLQREAQAMARLIHPNVIAVHDVGRVGDAVFVAMDFVAGQTLSDWMKGSERTWSESLSVLLQAGAGLAAAHGARLVHRDFKPDNVMVGDDGRVVVLDFGLARAAGDGEECGPYAEVGSDSTADGEQSNALETPMTRAGSVLGTPAYMAPEQHLGLPADARSDQFSFCVSAYQALYGRRPFVGDTVASLTLAVTDGEIQTPPTDSPVPVHLWRALRRGLERDPDQRWPDMESLLVALRRDPRQARRRVVSRMLGVAGVGVVVAGAWSLGVERGPTCDGAPQIEELLRPERLDRIRGAFGATGLGFARSAADRSMAAFESLGQQWVGGYRDACEATHVQGGQSAAVLDLRMACLEERRTEIDELLTIFESADADVVRRSVDAVLGVRPVKDCADTRALRQPLAAPDSRIRQAATEVRRSLSVARARESSGRYAAGLEAPAQALERARGLDHPPLLAEALLQHARFLERTGKFDEAESHLREAVQMAAAGRHAEVEARAWQRLMFVVGARRREFEKALALVLPARAALARLPDPELATAGLENNLGVLYDRMEKPDQAREHHERALATRERLLGSGHPGTAGSLTNLAVALEHGGQLAEAVEAYERAAAMLTDRLGAGHPHLAIVHLNLGNALDSQDRLEEAENHYREALTIQRAALGEEHPDLAISLNNLGLLLERRDRVEEAVDCYEQALALQEKALESEHPALQITRDNLANAREIMAGRVVPGSAPSDAAG